MEFKSIRLGQTIMKYQVPFDIFNIINDIYEKNFEELPSANNSLIGKIKKEHSIYYDGLDETKVKKHRILPVDILKWFEKVYLHYLNWNEIPYQRIHINSIWINEMKEHEYNPVHIHNGNLFTGLSSVMILKLPDSYGEEYSASHAPQNGKLQILGSSAGQFAKIDYEPNVQLRDFYVFPYDMRHCVYPFNGSNQKRRSLAANCDVQYNPVMNRGVTDE